LRAVIEPPIRRWLQLSERLTSIAHAQGKNTRAIR
jgi:hypothetical protein